MPGMLEIRQRPKLRRPVLLAGFSGWGNGGSVSTGAIEYLLGEPRPEPCAVADPDLCFDFTVARPTTTRGGPDGWKLTLPSLAVYAVARPNAPRDLLLVLGPEPNFRWVALSAAIAALAGDLGVEMAFTLGGFIGPVSHKRTALARRTLHAPLSLALAELGATETRYEGPTSFQSALLHGLHDQGIPTAGIWVANPPYVQGANPRATLALLQLVDQVAELGLDLSRLRAQSTDWSKQIDQVLRSNPQLTTQLGQLVDLDAEPERRPDHDLDAPPATAGELPNPSNVVEELERFLRQNQRPPEEQPGQ